MDLKLNILKDDLKVFSLDTYPNNDGNSTCVVFGAMTDAVSGCQHAG